MYMYIIMIVKKLGNILVKSDTYLCSKVHSHLGERSQINMLILELVNQARYPRRVCVFTIVVVV